MYFIFIFLISLFISSSAYSLSDGDDVIYAVKSTGGSTQDWGTIAPSTGNFTSILQISPTGLGWPLGDIGSEPDPINGYVFTRQTNSNVSQSDILAIKKSDGTTQWLGLEENAIVVGYDTKENNLIYRTWTTNTRNTLKSFNFSTQSTSTATDIDSLFSSSTNVNASTSLGTPISHSNLGGYVTLKTSAGGDQSSTSFTILGTDLSGNSINEVVTGADDGATATSSKIFKTVTSITPGSSVGTGTLTVGHTLGKNIGNFAGSVTSFQAGGIGAVDSYSRTAFQLLRPGGTSTLYKINLDDGTETTVTISSDIVTIAWDSKKQKLYGVYDSNSGGGYRVAEINTSNGSLTNISAADSVSGMSNYVQVIAPNDQRYYIQESGGSIRAISLTDGSSLGTFSAPLRLMPPGAVVLGDASTDETVTFDINASDSKLIKKGANEVTYTGTNNSSGGVDIDAGTLKVASSTNLGSGSVSLEGGELEISADATITNAIASTDDTSAIDTGTNTVTVSGVLSGSNKINKTGTGTLTLTGTNTNTTGVEIDQGTLVANGAGSMPVIVNSGTLQGSGTVGNLTSSSTVEPGNSIGTLNVSGTVTLNSGSVLVIEVDTAGNNDKIVATGAVTAGGTLRISPGSGTYSSNQQYTIITGSGISGTFSSITVLSCSGSASANYGSTSIIITLSSCSFNAPKNRETISSYVNDLSSGASGDLSTVITALNTLSGDNYNNALEALDYNTSGAISSVVQSQVASINNVIGQRVAASTIGNNKVVSLVGFLKSSSSIDQSNTPSFEDKLKQMGMTGWWTQVHGGTGDKKSLKDIGVNGYDFNHFGTTIGFDQQTDKGIDGLALTFQQGTIDSDNNEGSTDHKTFAVSKYQSSNIEDGKRRTLSGSFGITNVDSSRTLNFASINRKATASYNSYSLNGSAEYIYPEKNWFGSAHNLSVNGGLTLNYQEGFTETGANALNLKVDSNQTQLVNAGLVDTIYWSDKTEGEIIPFLSLGLHTSYHLGSVESKQRFVNQTNFTTKSDRRSNTHGEIGVGFIQSKDNNTELSFLAKSKFSDKLSENTATFKYSVKF